MTHTVGTKEFRHTSNAISIAGYNDGDSIKIYVKTSSGDLSAALLGYYTFTIDTINAENFTVNENVPALGADQQYAIVN